MENITATNEQAIAQFGVLRVGDGVDVFRTKLHRGTPQVKQLLPYYKMPVHFTVERFDISKNRVYLTTYDVNADHENPNTVVKEFTDENGVTQLKRVLTVPVNLDFDYDDLIQTQHEYTETINTHAEKVRSFGRRILETVKLSRDRIAGKYRPINTSQIRTDSLYPQADFIGIEPLPNEPTKSSKLVPQQLSFIGGSAALEDITVDSQANNNNDTSIEDAILRGSAAVIKIDDDQKLIKPKVEHSAAKAFTSRLSSIKKRFGITSYLSAKILSFKNSFENKILTSRNRKMALIAGVGAAAVALVGVAWLNARGHVVADSAPTDALLPSGGGQTPNPDLSFLPQSSAPSTIPTPDIGITTPHSVNPDIVPDGGSLPTANEAGPSSTIPTVPDTTPVVPDSPTETSVPTNDAGWSGATEINQYSDKARNVVAGQGWFKTINNMELEGMTNSRMVEVLEHAGPKLVRLGVAYVDGESYGISSPGKLPNEALVIIEKTYNHLFN